MRTLLLIAGAVVWGVVIFVLALHVHFPGETILDRARYEVEQASDGKWAIDADGLDLWRVSGVSADNLVLYDVESKRHRRRRVRRRASGSDDVDNPEDEEMPALKATPFVRFDEVRARVALLPMLLGTQQVDFDAAFMGGELDGTYAQADTRTQFELEATDLDLSMLPLKGKTWEVNAMGALQIAAEMDLNADNPRESTGEIHLQIDQFAIQSAKAMGIDLTPVAFSEAVFDVQLANGKAEIVNGVLDGDILDATFSGNVSMSKRSPDRWRLRVEVKLELDDTLDQFARFSPDLKDARDDDGVYHLTCMGTMTKPNCMADRLASGKVKGGVRAAAQKRRLDLKDDGPGAAPLSDEERDAAREERRRKRMERIAERRERLREDRKLEVDPEDFDDMLNDPPLPDFPNGDGPRPMRMREDFDPQRLDPEYDLPVGQDGEPFLPDDMDLEGPIDAPLPIEPPFDDDDLPEPY